MIKLFSLTANAHLVPLSRTSCRALAQYVVTEEDIYCNLDAVVQLSNLLPGPLVLRDSDRGGGYGLAARQTYKKDELITRYGGVVVRDPRGLIRGDYVAACGKSDIIIDGHWGFTLAEKGRWINESDAQRSIVNVKISRLGVYATRAIAQDEWLFADYGDEYERVY